MSNTISSNARRHVLKGTVAAMAMAGLASWTKLGFAADAKPLPGYADWKIPGDIIVHSNNTLETKRSAYGTSVITPNDQLFVRNNLPPPDAAILKDRDAWVVEIDGVAKPAKLTLAELKTMGLETTAMVLQCSGNGRGFFPHKPSGTPWKVGAAGCVVWSGVPVRALVQAHGGVKAGAKYMTGTGGEKLPDGLDPLSVIVERSVSADAMEDALLAWEMNGEPISLAHGGPLRLIVPGFTGVNNIKYIKRLAFTEQETKAKIMSHGYRITPIGGTSGPDLPSVQQMSIKSWINAPLPEDGAIKAGRVQIHGVAFGGTHAVKGVEVSTDGGKTWTAAKFVGPDLGKYAWRQFVLEANLKPGEYQLASRATDTSGESQPEARVENKSGYNNNSWLDHSIKVSVA